MTVGGPGLGRGQRIGYVEHADCRVAYATLGSGPPLLCDVAAWSTRYRRGGEGPSGGQGFVEG
jgi:hypothetical protein